MENYLSHKTLKSSFLKSLLMAILLSCYPAWSSASEEKPKQVSVEEASRHITQQLKKHITEETPEAFITVYKKMTSDKEFASQLTRAIGTQSSKEAGTLLQKATGISMQVTYVGEEEQMLRIKLCARRNGVLRCFPSQRNSVACLKF